MNTLKIFLKEGQMLPMPETRKVTTVCNGKREIRTDYGQARHISLCSKATGEDNIKTYTHDKQTAES